MKMIRIFDRRILWVGALVIFIFLMLDLNSRLGEMLRLNSEKVQVSAQLTQLVSTQEHLQTQIAYATSDVAVQDWARQEGHMALPGDIPIVPLAPANSTPTPETPPIPTTPPVENWQVWDALFFGK